jgi:hypothetical protein
LIVVGPTSSQTDRQLVTGCGIDSGHIGAKTLHTKNLMFGLHLVLINGLKCSVCVCS